jgi:AcrR family transcriptional regulator
MRNKFKINWHNHQKLMNRYEENKQRIRIAFFEAAIVLILEKGYDAVSVTEICNQADYGRSTFYLYFKDKEALVWAMLHHYMVVTDAELLQAIQPLQSPAREWTAWYMICQSAAFQRPFFLKLNGELTGRLRQWQKEHLFKTFEQQLRDGTYSLLSDVPPEIGARFITGALLDVLEYWVNHPEAGDAETIAAHFFRLVFRQEPPI